MRPIAITIFILLLVSTAAAVEHREVATSPLVDGAPGFAPDGQTISFSSNRTGDWEIYTVGAWGGDPVNFTNHPDTDIYANWKPDGEFIIFTSTRDNGSGSGDMDLWIRSLAGDSLGNLTDWEGYDNFAAFNPDGDWIAFTSDRGPQQRKSIWKMDLARGELTQLSFGLSDCFHSNWSPDGQWIAFDGRDPADPNHIRLYRVHVDGGPVQEIPQGMSYAVDPGHSPDGRYLAFGGGNHLTDWDLWLWDFENEALIQLTSTRVAEQSPLWSLDGSEIVYARVASENKDVWIAYELGLDTPVRKGSWSDLKRSFGR